MLESLKNYCPYCGESIELLVDPSMAGQTYTEDCEVCCRPMRVSVSEGAQSLNADSWAYPLEALPGEQDMAALSVTVRREDDID